MYTIIRWPDGTECLPEDMPGMNHMSDDFERVEVPDFYEVGSGYTSLLYTVGDDRILVFKDARVPNVKELIGFEVVDVQVLASGRLALTLQPQDEDKMQILRRSAEDGRRARDASQDAPALTIVPSGAVPAPGGGGESGAGQD